MDKISYTLEPADCSDYVKTQFKIPRLRKFILKSYTPFWVIGLIFALIYSLPIFTGFYKGTRYLMTNNGLSFFQALTDASTIDFYKSCGDFIIYQILPFILIWLCIFFVSCFFISHDLFKLYSKKIYKMLEGRLSAEVEICDDGLDMKGKGIASFLKWDGIVDIYEAKTVFLIFVSDFQAIIIPKRAFETPEKAKDFFNFVNEKVSNAKN